MDENDDNNKSDDKPELPVLPKPDASKKPRQSVFITILELVVMFVVCVWLYYEFTDDSFWEGGIFKGGGLRGESIVTKIWRLVELIVLRPERITRRIGVLIALCVVGIGSIIYLIVSKKDNDDQKKPPN